MVVGYSKVVGVVERRRTVINHQVFLKLLTLSVLVDLKTRL